MLKGGLVIIRELYMNLELTLLNRNVLPSHFYVVKMGKQAGKFGKIFLASMLA